MLKNILLIIAFCSLNAQILLAQFSKKPTVHLVFCSPFEGNYMGMNAVYNDFSNFFPSAHKNVKEVKKHYLLGKECNTDNITALMESIADDPNAIAFVHVYAHGENKAARLPHIECYKSPFSTGTDYLFDVDKNVVAFLAKHIRFAVVLVDACNLINLSSDTFEAVTTKKPLLVPKPEKNTIYVKKLEELFLKKHKGHIAISTSRIEQKAFPFKDLRTRHNYGGYGSNEFYSLMSQAPSREKHNWFDLLNKFKLNVAQKVKEDLDRTQTPIFFGELNKEPILSENAFHLFASNLRNKEQSDTVINTIYDDFKPDYNVQQLCTAINKQNFSEAKSLVEDPRKFLHINDFSILNREPHTSFVTLKDYFFQLEKNPLAKNIKWLETPPQLVAIGKTILMPNKTSIIYTKPKLLVHRDGRLDTLNQAIVVTIDKKLERFGRKAQRITKRVNRAKKNKTKKRRQGKLNRFQKRKSKRIYPTHVYPIPSAPKPPVSKLKANPDQDTTNMNISVSTDVLANDSDRDQLADLNTLEIIHRPRNGRAGVDVRNGKILYTPSTDYFGQDSYTYRICAGSAGCSTAKVDITVLEKIDLLKAANEYISAQTDTILRDVKVWYDFNGTQYKDPAKMHKSLEISQNLFRDLDKDSITVYRPFPDRKQEYYRFSFRDYITQVIFRDYKKGFKWVTYGCCPAPSLHVINKGHLRVVETDKKWIGYLDFYLAFTAVTKVKAPEKKNLTRKTLAIEITHKGFDKSGKPLFERTIIDMAAKGISNDTNICPTTKYTVQE